jgi:ribonucleoside-diphosphate reductase beta chain
LEEAFVEPILRENPNRFTLFPIMKPKLFQKYKNHLSVFWVAEEIDLAKDMKDWVKLSANEQHFIKNVLAFFAASDGIVNENLSKNFASEVTVPEARCFYGLQIAIENIHSETYSLMLDNLIKDPTEKDFLFQSIKTVESVKKLGDWAMHWIESDLSFAHRVVAFAVVEGIFFSGAFASIFWLKRYKSNGRLFLQGLVKSNEFIARDEGMHVQFACEIYKLLETKLSKEAVFTLIDDGVKVAKIFMKDALPIRLLGMNSDSMEQYIECVADRLSMDLGYKKMYNTPNPFVFMETIGMLGKSNFFESRPTDYQSAFNQDNKRTTNLETFEDDF